MKLLLKIIFLTIFVIGLVYMLLPTPEFPAPPDNAIQSNEPADTETPLRRAYFVNQTREEVIAHYEAQFSKTPTIKLNYPPEEAQSIIRDQTRSSYLEELVHPFRESIYINGFVPLQKKDAILIDGMNYYQKITVRYVPSSLITRLIYLVATVVLSWFLLHNFAKLIVDSLNWVIKIVKK